MSRHVNKRKSAKNTSTYHFVGSSAEAGPSASSKSRVLREKTRIRQSDGHVSQARTLVDIAAPPREAPVRVHPDVRRDRPIYDWYSGGDIDVDRVDEVLEEEEEGGGRQARNSDHPLRQWAEDHLTNYVEECLHLEGRVLDGQDVRAAAAEASRASNTARALAGNRICPVPMAAANDDFVIVDIHGVHEVGLDYCGCGQGGHPTIQLLRAQLWPATTTSPKTAATFAVLRQYHLLSFESKCSALEFYQSLARQSDNLSLKKRWKSKQDRANTAEQHKDRYHAFLRMTREWHHVRMLKRAGQGHDPDGIANTKPGECALLCPACPQSGKNMRPDWENAPEDQQFLDAMFLAIDANFRLIRKDVSTEERDPGLGKGYAFYGDVDAYMSHVKRHWNQKQERSHCVAYDAVDKPDREARGTASSGIGAVDCARHNMKRPLAVGDLQLGERRTARRQKRGWANANPLARSTREMGPGSRRDTLDDHFNDWNHKKIIALGITLAKKVEIAVAEMVRTRAALGDLEESLGVESVERWTAMATRWELDVTAPNPFETQYKDMHIAKVRAELAAEAAAREAAGTEDAGAVRGDMHITEMVDMGLQLEDQQRILASDVASTGLHPTDGQRRAMIERTSKLRRKILAWIDVQTRFFPGLKNIREVEDRSRVQIGSGEPIPGIAVSDIKLWLPSAIAATSQKEVPVSRDTYQHEYRLRVGQAQEALHEVRRLLLVRTHLYKLKDTHSRGVQANMRSNDKIAALNGQVQRAAEQYRAARGALVVLSGVLCRTEWERTLWELKPDDVRGLPQSTFHDPERKNKSKTNRRRRKKQKREREMSWIWVTQGGHDPADPPAMTEAVRIEWAKVRARCHRWREEVDLLEAEMARGVEISEDAQLEGETAYDYRQAAIQTKLGGCFAEDWKALPDLIQRGRAGEMGEDGDEAVVAVEEDDTDSEGGSSDDEEEAVIGTLPQREIKSSYVDEVLVM
ncbi:hypothetical protein B0H14DRAFT_3668571 [Mycena olivaceomarginata]|nr:hypothetical protein B0H14DRAFT_3668571 [Mycena olivaceomarginata]